MVTTLRLESKVSNKNVINMKRTIRFDMTVNKTRSNAINNGKNL